MHGWVTATWNKLTGKNNQYHATAYLKKTATVRAVTTPPASAVQVRANAAAAGHRRVRSPAAVPTDQQAADFDSQGGAAGRALGRDSTHQARPPSQSHRTGITLEQVQDVMRLLKDAGDAPIDGPLVGPNGVPIEGVEPPFVRRLDMSAGYTNPAASDHDESDERRRAAHPQRPSHRAS